METDGSIIWVVFFALLAVVCLFLFAVFVSMLRDGITKITLSGDTTVGGAIFMLVATIACGAMVVDQYNKMQVSNERHEAAIAAFDASVRSQGFTLVNTTGDFPSYSYATVAIEGGCQLSVAKPEWDGTKAVLRATSPSGASYILTPALLQEQCKP